MKLQFEDKLFSQEKRVNSEGERVKVMGLKKFKDMILLLNTFLK